MKNILILTLFISFVILSQAAFSEDVKEDVVGKAVIVKRNFDVTMQGCARNYSNDIPGYDRAGCLVAPLGEARPYENLIKGTMIPGAYPKEPLPGSCRTAYQNTLGSESYYSIEALNNGYMITVANEWNFTKDQNLENIKNFLITCEVKNVEVYLTTKE